MDRQNVLKKSEDRDCRKEKGMTAGKEIMRSSRDLRLTGHARLVRARLKGWRQAAPNLLSAHLFFSALCKASRRRDFAETLLPIGLWAAPRRELAV